MSKRNQNLTKYLSFGFILALTGWGGLVILVLFTLPTLGPRWLFFFLVMLALSGTFFPFVAFLHRRFPSTPPVESGVILRQTVWVALFGGLLAWLQLGRALDANRALFLAIGFITIESLTRAIERSRWKPKDSENHE